MLKSAASVTTTPHTESQANLGESVFQKLLEAAWVLQESRDRAASRQMPISFGSSPAIDPISVESTRLELGTLGDTMHRSTAEITSPPPSSRFATVPVQPTLLGSVEVATDALGEYGIYVPPSAPPAAPPPAEFAKLLDVFRGLTYLPTASEPIQRQQMAVRAMRVFAAVLVVAAAYSIVQTQFRRSAQTNAALAASAEAGGITPTLPEASASTAASAIQSVKLTAPVPSRSTRVPLAPSRVISPAMPLSHRQITDPSTRFALGGLSRYEVKSLARKARYGDDSAAMTLAMAYETGRYVRQNCRTAAHWVALAAKNGNPAAEYNLGLRYGTGDGVPVDQKLSVVWIRKSAGRKYAKAQSLLPTLTAR